MKSGEHVLVGLGYDDDGRAEIDWAAREAQARAAALDVVRAYDLSEIAEPWMASPDRALVEELRDEAEQAVDAAVAHVRARWPAVDVSARVVYGRPAEVLIEGSRDAAVTVLGGRQLGALGAVVLGSVSNVVAARASGPVVVVGRHGAEEQLDPVVVVGVDGSSLMEDVLGFAFDYASRYRATLHAIACWRHTVQEVSPWPPPYWETQAEHCLAAGFRGWLDKYPDVATRREVVHRGPVDALVSAAAGQNLLVVGSRSRTSRHAPLLGSVSQGVLHHAQCPVAVVHPQGDLS